MNEAYKFSIEIRSVYMIADNSRMRIVEIGVKTTLTALLDAPAKLDITMYDQARSKEFQ